MKPSVFDKINSWQDFKSYVESLPNTKQMGNAFEHLTYLYFKLDPKYSFYDEVYKMSEVPQSDLDKLNIPREDLGIDLIAKFGNEYHPIQCKYHTDTKRSITFKEVSTFLTLLESNNNFKMGYLTSTADNTSKNYNKLNTKEVQKLLSNTWLSLDKCFFDRVREFEKGNEYSPEPFYPREHQSKAVDNAYKHFIKENNSRGKLIFPCGAGKSLTGFWMMEKLASKSTLVAVPSLSLIKQTLDVYLKEIVARKRTVKWLCICSDEGIGKNDDILYKTSDLGVPCTTDINYIEHWLERNSNNEIIVFTTYQSGRIIADVSKALNFTFDLGIYDEAHKTVGKNESLFSYLLFEKNISIKYRIFMTATERFYRGLKDDVLTMDDQDDYGEVFSHMTFKEAIERKLLTDYKVITIEVNKEEVAEFIRENNLVKLNAKWGKESEARSLASMIALRKAMKAFPIKNAVSFHSSIDRAVRSKEVQNYISETYNYKPIETFTVSGKLPTSKREVVVNEFANSNKALITNSRCLTEGVDVPNIDCIVFADPRKSKVDIVQALGRALRKKKGKEWGYVILPIIYDHKTQEIDNENFQEILNIVRGLAANDERLIEEFKDKSKNKGRVIGAREEIFSIDPILLEDSEFANNLGIRLWENLSRFNWLSFKEASDFTRKLKLKSINDWRNYCKKGKKPHNVPYHPDRIYTEFKKSGGYNYWLNIERKSNWEKSDFFFTYSEAKLFLKEECKGAINSMPKFKKWAEGKLDNVPKIPEKMPKKPWGAYKDEWTSSFDFFGKKPQKTSNGTYPHAKYKKIPYEELKKVCQENKIQTRKECRDWLLNNQEYFNKRGFYAPLKGGESYKEFNGWAEFLNSQNPRVVAYRKDIKKFSYEEAKAFIKELNLNSKTEFFNYIKGNYKNKKEVSESLPRSPRNHYLKRGWKGWPDFLGKE